MSILLKYKDIEIKCNTILWDRDSFFIDFEKYWTRLVGSIAQKIAENTTDNWSNFNQVRTLVINTLGINSETGIKEPEGLVSYLPLDVLPSLIAARLKNLSPDKKHQDLIFLFQDLINKSLSETKTYIKDALITKNIEMIKKLALKVKQILVTNDSKENNDSFLKEAKLENCFTGILACVNKEQLNHGLNLDAVFVTENTFLKDSYTRRQTKNIFLIKDLTLLSFEESKDELITINIDGASKGNPGPSGIGIVFYKDHETIDEISEYIGTQTNNFCEYTALIRALETSLNKGYTSVEIYSDSELVVKQINKIYKVKDADIKELFDKAYSLIQKFSHFKITHVPREENLRADKLANAALKKLTMNSNPPN